MIKPPFIEELEKNLRPEERIFKFRSAELCGNNFCVELLVDHNAYDDALNEELKNKVFAATKKLIPESLSVDIKYVKANNEDQTIIKHIMEFVYKEKPTIYNGFVDADIGIEVAADVIFIKITIEKYLYEYAVNSNMKKELEEYLQGWLMEDADIEFIAVPNKEEGIISRRAQANSVAISTINVAIKDYYYGSIPFEPRYISDVKDKEMAQVVICGVLSNIKCRYIEKINKNLYSFNINDTSASMKVKFFGKPFSGEITPADEAIAAREKELEASGQKKIKKLRNRAVNWDAVFTDGAQLVMQGQIKFDNYDKSNVFMARSVASCVIDYSSINLDKDLLPEPEEYTKVFPEPMEVFAQQNMFEQRSNPELKKHTYVVFDLETTGLDAASDSIIEIAAIKIVDGNVKESFSCFVNPEVQLPQKIVELTNITDEMLAHSYKISDVIGDFYKFTRDAILVAHNAPFDMGFLTIAGRKNFYNFDNAFIDTLALSRKTLTSLRHHNLDSVCKALNISLVGAHRAINDTLATAKVFIELMNRQNY